MWLEPSGCERKVGHDVRVQICRVREAAVQTFDLPLSMGQTGSSEGNGNRRIRRCERERLPGRL